MGAQSHGNWANHKGQRHNVSGGQPKMVGPAQGGKMRKTAASGCSLERLKQVVHVVMVMMTGLPLWAGYGQD